MNPEELEDLLRELVQGIQQVMQSGEVLSDEFQGVLAQTLSNLVDRIDEVRSQQQQQQEQETQIPAAQNEIHPDLQLLWILSGQNENNFISYLRTYPTVATRQILSNPILLNQTINQLNQLMPPGQPISADGIPHADLNSSNVFGMKYDPRSQKMRVRFQNGSIYEYDGIPENIYRAFASGNSSAKTKGINQYGAWWPGKNPSLGAALNQYIKLGGFNYRKIR